MLAVRSGAGAARDTRGAWLVIAAFAAAVIAAAILAVLVLGRRLAAPLDTSAPRHGGSGRATSRSARPAQAPLRWTRSALPWTPAPNGWAT